MTQIDGVKAVRAPRAVRIALAAAAGLALLAIGLGVGPTDERPQPGPAVRGSVGLTALAGTIRRGGPGAQLEGRLRDPPPHHSGAGSVGRLARLPGHPLSGREDRALATSISAPALAAI